MLFMVVSTVFANLVVCSGPAWARAWVAVAALAAKAIAAAQMKCASTVFCICLYLSERLRTGDPDEARQQGARALSGQGGLRCSRRNPDAMPRPGAASRRAELCTSCRVCALRTFGAAAKSDFAERAVSAQSLH